MCDLGDETQFLFLRRAWNRIPVPYGAETALSGERHVIAREETASLFNPTHDFINGSVSVRLVEINPRTTCFPAGISRSGSKEPERQSSYSRRKREKLFARANTARAIAS